MSPSDEQLKNLSRMTEILSSNRQASLLAHSLWDFFNFHLYCTIYDDDGESNRCRTEGIDRDKVVGDIRILILLRRNERLEEGLVHELLHANLIPLGYPKFWIQSKGDKHRLAGGIINNADHVVMRPIYLSFGYAEDRFLGPSQSHSDREKRVLGDIEQMGNDLLTPNGYINRVSAYLHAQDIDFAVVHPAKAIVEKKIYPSKG